jgi:hypothetical protein
MNDVQLATVLAALRYWQHTVPLDQRSEKMPCHFEDVEPLNDEAIEELCEELNQQNIAAS